MGTGWTHPAGDPSSAAYAADTGHVGDDVAWSVQTDGYLTTPVIADGQLFATAGVLTGQDAEGATAETSIVAFDLADGTERWRTALPGKRFTDCPPTVLNGAVYVGSLGPDSAPPTLYALDPSTGAERWSSELPGAASTPAVYDGRLYVTSFDSRTQEGRLLAFE